MVFQYDSYKQFIRQWIESQPSKGRGEIAKLGQSLNVSPSLISAILTTDRHFSAEQACELTEYFNLKKIESDYFIALVSHEKAGSEKLKKFWAQQKREILKKSQEVKSRVEFEKILTSEQQTQYYSHAIYSQIRVLSTLENGISFSELIGLIKMPENRLNNAIEFLLEAKLIMKNNESYVATEKMVFVNKESPDYLRHHMNWRLQQLQQVTSTTETDLTFTFPCTLSQSDFKNIKVLLVEAIAKTSHVIRDSPPEEFACLTIDFISYFNK